MQEKSREIWVGKTRFYLGEDNILYETIVGDIDEKIAIVLREATFEFMKIAGEKLDILIDINKAGKPSKEARNMFLELNKLEGLGKIAIFGMHPVARVIASFGMGVSKKKELRFFKTKAGALEWLKE